MANVRPLRPQSLAEVVDLAMEKQQVDSGRALARRSEELDLALSYTVINNLRRNQYLHRFTEEKRERLAKLAGVPRRVVDELAGIRSLAPFKLPERATELTGDQRKAVLAVVNAFIEANEAVEQAQADADMVIAAYRPDQPPGTTTDDQP